MLHHADDGQYARNSCTGLHMQFLAPHDLIQSSTHLAFVAQLVEHLPKTQCVIEPPKAALFFSLKISHYFGCIALFITHVRMQSGCPDFCASQNAE